MKQNFTVFSLQANCAQTIREIYLVLLNAQNAYLESFFSILCLTTDFIHQGHEKRKEIRDVSTFTAQHVRTATRSIKCERQ